MTELDSDVTRRDDTVYIRVSVETARHLVDALEAYTIESDNKTQARVDKLVARIKDFTDR